MAYEDFADILLQILDDGRLTDNKGRTVSFTKHDHHDDLECEGLPERV